MLCVLDFWFQLFILIRVKVDAKEMTTTYFIYKFFKCPLAWPIKTSNTETSNYVKEQLVKWKRLFAIQK